MALTLQEQDTLPQYLFGLPDSRTYPIPDSVHARMALARAAQHATPVEQAEIRHNVHRLYPRIKIGK